MRLAVLDIGSNTVHLLIVDARPGSPPVPTKSVRTELSLLRHLDESGAITPKGQAKLLGAVQRAVVEVEDLGASELVAFATSAIREAANGRCVMEMVFAETGVELKVLDGVDEAAITFLAVRRWLGWSAGRILMADIGGGSLELAAGSGETPDEALSFPLGATRLSRDWFAEGSPPSLIMQLRAHVRREIAASGHDLVRAGAADHAVATSKAFSVLSRAAGTPGVLHREDLPRLVGEFAQKAPEDIAADLKVSLNRARGLLAAAVVGDAVTDLLDVPELVICPWALREGLILRRLGQLS